MKTHIIKLFSIILILTFFSSCDKIENPLKEQSGTCGDASIKPIKKILVEEYTGVRCVNCPDAAEILHEIKTDYCDYVIPMAIHVGPFATPYGENDDYRTDAGTSLANEFGNPMALPWGSVNRIVKSGTASQKPEDWRASVDILRKTEPEVNIIIENEYNETSKKVISKIKIEILKDISYKLNIGLYITEDSIVSKQSATTGSIAEYTHRHMFRESISEVFGNEFANSATQGRVLEKSFTFDTDTIWEINNTQTLVFISNAETKEIVQAEVKEIIQK